MSGPSLGRRVRSTSTGSAASSAAGPIFLMTLDVPFELEATSLAVESALESGQALHVVNVAQVPLLPLSTALGYEYLGSPELDAALRAPAELAASLGVRVERLRVCTPRPVAALVEVIAERRPGLVVFGPDRAQVAGRLYRRAAAAVREHAPCLVWLAA